MKAGVSWLTPHGLRRYFFTACRRAGVPLEVAMWFADWRDVRTALECYREIGEQDYRAAVK